MTKENIACFCTVPFSSDVRNLNDLLPIQAQDIHEDTLEHKEAFWCSLSAGPRAGLNFNDGFGGEESENAFFEPLYI